MYLDRITSKTALIETAIALEKMALEFRHAAEFLDRKRNRVNYGEHDKRAISKAGIALKSLPGFPNIDENLRRNVAMRFAVPIDEFDQYARSLMARERGRIADEKQKRARAMAASGMRQNKIARVLNLSPARVSQMVRDDPDRDEAKRLGVPKSVYLEKIKHLSL